jgi:hypothetical protein
MKAGIGMKFVKNAYVVKSWTASNQMDGEGNYINIEGRAGGLLSWILNLLGVSPTVWLKARGDRIIFHEGSFEGTSSFLTPMESICSMFYAYKRPLVEAIFIGVILGGLTFFLLGIPGIVIALLYYFLNKRLLVGFTDLGGHVREMAFKRSVIEGNVIDVDAASEVCNILQSLVDARREVVIGAHGSRPSSIVTFEPHPPLPTAAPPAPGPAPATCSKCGGLLDAGSSFCDECGTRVD